MATGLPVIATQHSGIPELIEHDVTGWLVPERDVGAICDTLFKIIEAPSATTEVAKAARQHIEEFYALDVVHEALKDAYSHAMDSPAA